MKSCDMIPKPEIVGRKSKCLALGLEYPSSSRLGLPWWNLWTSLEQFVCLEIDNKNVGVNS